MSAFFSRVALVCIGVLLVSAATAEAQRNRHDPRGPRPRVPCWPEPVVGWDSLQTYQKTALLSEPTGCGFGVVFLTFRIAPDGRSYGHLAYTDAGAQTDSAATRAARSIAWLPLSRTCTPEEATFRASHSISLEFWLAQPPDCEFVGLTANQRHAAERRAREQAENQPPFPKDQRRGLYEASLDSLLSVFGPPDRRRRDRFDAAKLDGCFGSCGAFLLNLLPDGGLFDVLGWYREGTPSVYISVPPSGEEPAVLDVSFPSSDQGVLVY